MKEKIILFGASGKTGLEILRNAKINGLQIDIFLRKGTTLPSEFSNLNVFEGDVLNIDDVDKAIKDHTIVISTLGVKGNSKIPVVSQGTKNIIEVMKKYKINRLIVQSAHGASESAKEMFLPVRIIMLNFLLKHPFQDKNVMEGIVKDSNLIWTIIRPTRLTDSNKEGKYRVGENLNVGLNPHISRKSVAEFILSLIYSKTYQNKTVTITI